jgi:hypothetical protein
MALTARFLKTLSWALGQPIDVTFGIENAMYAKRGSEYAAKMSPCNTPPPTQQPGPVQNRLREYFDALDEGNGIFKFLHYFDIYERHFSKFVGKEVHIVEVGVYSGGSLKMWHNYFGDKCHVYGVDILQECEAYEEENTKIFIGDQESRDFWRDLKRSVPRVDILIDDGGHLAEQQIVTLEEILPHLSPGGVYMCEDISGSRMKLTAYMNGLQNELNSFNGTPSDPDRSRTTPFQQQVNSIHQYPYAFVIEKNDEPVGELSAVKKGTIWNPFHKATLDASS